jgi:mRNA-degrading endonuclease toxin of MazEF toxin-antitoxin module
MIRGAIWWAVLPDPIASEPGYRRPVLLIQSDAFTRSLPWSSRGICGSPRHQGMCG